MIEREPWARQPGETSRAYSAFCIYRDLGPRHRSLRETARRYYQDKTRTKPVQIGVWSSKHNWVERCRQYDEFLDEQRRQEALNEILDMARRQAQEGTTLQHLGAKILEALLTNSDGSPKIRVSGNVLDAVRALRTGAEIERLARGMPTQIIEEQAPERDFLVIIPPTKKAED